MLCANESFQINDNCVLEILFKAYRFEFICPIINNSRMDPLRLYSFKKFSLRRNFDLYKLKLKKLQLEYA